MSLSDRLAEYEIIAELARSASSRILIAQTPGSKHLFAIKEMILEPDSGLSSEEQVARFKREADIHLQLNHPNIIKCYAAGVDGDRQYLVMEYQPGHTWHAMMNSARRSPIPQVLEWGVQLCYALQHLHEQGIVHRDIKPANCLISPAGQLKLADFGMARRAFAPGITQAKMMLGTLNYMSPEQLLDATAVDGRSDVFAAGVILFKALTGSLPFAGETPTDVAHRLLYAEPTNPLTLNADLPKSLGYKLLKCLSKDPDFRYLSADSFAWDLEEELHNTAIYLAQGFDHACHGEWKDANHCFQQSVAMDTASPVAWFQLGESLQHLDQAEQASECYLKVIQLDSSHVEAYRRLGEAYRRTGNLGVSIKMFQRAWTLDPNDQETCLTLAIAYREQGQPQEALDQLSYMVEHYPEWERAHFELGRARYAIGMLEDALSSFRKAYRLSPADRDIVFNLASLSQELGQLVEAEEYYDKLFALSPEGDNVHAFHNMACLCFSLSRFEEAETFLQAVLDQKSWGQSYLLLGKVYDCTGRLKEAIEVYRQALSLLPNQADVPILLAGALQRNFQLNAAIEVLHQAAELDGPDQARIYYHLALAFRTRGDEVQAIEALNACLANRPSGDLLKAVEEVMAVLRRSKPSRGRLLQ